MPSMSLLENVLWGREIKVAKIAKSLVRQGRLNFHLYLAIGFGSSEEKLELIHRSSDESVFKI